MNTVTLLGLRPGQYTWTICGACSGHGKRDNPAFSNGISAETFHHEWSDEDRENYLSGMYDVPCTDCQGSGKVAEPIWGQLTFGQRRALVKAQRSAQWHEESRREQEREMRMLGEWRD